MPLARRARQVGQILHPIIAIGPPVRGGQHERFLVLIRLSILITVFMAFGLVMLLLFWSSSFLLYHIVLSASFHACPRERRSSRGLRLPSGNHGQFTSI